MAKQGSLVCVCVIYITSLAAIRQEATNTNFVCLLPKLNSEYTLILLHTLVGLSYITRISTEMCVCVSVARNFKNVCYE